MPNQNTQRNDQADGKFDRNIKTPEEQVRQTEDASLQDDTYSFDEDNTDNEEYHDVDEDDSSELTNVFESDDDLQ